MTGLERLWALYSNVSIFAKTRLIVCDDVADKYEKEGFSDLGWLLRDIAKQIDDEQQELISHSDAIAWLESHGGFDHVKTLYEMLQIEMRDGDTEAAKKLSRGFTSHGMKAVAEAWEWVKSKGGLDAVKQQRRESVPREVYERKRCGFLDHIAECETALGKRNARIKELEDENTRCLCAASFIEHNGGLEEVNQNLAAVSMIAKRLGMEGASAFDVSKEACKRLSPDKLKPTLPKVFAADRVKIRAGETLFHIMSGDSVTARQLMPPDKFEDTDFVRHFASEYTHREPVFAADGKPLREGETVWSVRTGERFVVSSTRFKDHETGEPLFVSDEEGSIPIPAKWVTHERPDSWERITEDIATPYCADYCIKYGVDHSSMSFEYAKACDIVRRAKKLAGVE